MNSWFDIYNLDGKTPESLSDIRKEYSQGELEESADLLLNIVDQEMDKLPDKSSKRIFIGGFSQGCMVSLAAFMRYKGTEPLGGVLGLSGMQALGKLPEMSAEQMLAKK